jgi:hypothetical protein
MQNFRKSSPFTYYLQLSRHQEPHYVTTDGTALVLGAKLLCAHAGACLVRCSAFFAVSTTSTEHRFVYRFWYLPRGSEQTAFAFEVVT